MNENEQAKELLAKTQKQLGITGESMATGIPEGTHVFAWPRKPTAGKTLSGKALRAPSRGPRGAGRGRGRGGKKTGNWSGWDKI